jgi:hypothetical protein
MVRGRWGGVENRNHWQRDDCMGEDGSRTRNPTLLHGPHSERRVASVLNEEHPFQSLPTLQEAYAANPSMALPLIKAN